MSTYRAGYGRRGWRKPKFRPIHGAGRAGFHENYCHALTADGRPCEGAALLGSYYCRGHQPQAKADRAPVGG